MAGEIKVPAGTLTRSVTSSYQTFASFAGQSMPNPDVLIRNKGIRFDTFREMLLDGTISGKFDQLFSWVKTKKLRFEGDNAETVEAALAGINLNALLGEMLTATQFGYSVQEIIWQDPKKNGGAWLVEKIVGRVQERFGFDYNGQLMYSGGMGVLSPITESFKFMVTRHNPVNENYYGSPILSKCYWPWMFKKAGFRFWVTAAEKFGVPTVLALFQSDNEERQSAVAEYLAGELSKIQNDAAVALANVDSIQTLEASGNAQGMFHDFLDVCNAEIGKAITGETMTSENGSGIGSYSLSSVHADTLDVKAQDIADEIADTLKNSVVKWIVQLNHGADAEVPEVFLTDIPQASFADVMSAVDRSIPVSISSLYDDYGLPRPDGEADTFTKPEASAGGMFGFSDIPEGEQSRFFRIQQELTKRSIRLMRRK